MKVRTTVAANTANIVIVKAVTNRGEKVFNAYILKLHSF